MTTLVNERFILALRNCRSCYDVVERLHSVVTAHMPNVRVLGIWSPPMPLNHVDKWELGKNVFMQRDVPEGFFLEWLEQTRREGPSMLARHTELESSLSGSGLPFTWRELQDKVRPTGKVGWVFGMLAKYGMHDGLHCALSHWIASYYTADERLELSELQIAGLFAAAMLAIHRADELVPPKLLRPEVPHLTQREFQVLVSLINGKKFPKGVADHLGIAATTVKTYVESLLEKLNCATREQLIWRAGQVNIIAGGHVAWWVLETAVAMHNAGHYEHHCHLRWRD